MVAIVQPDSRLAPRSPIGAVALAACLQLAFAVPTFYAQEHPTPPRLRDRRGRRPRSGRQRAPLEPGAPVWHYPDGSVQVGYRRVSAVKLSSFKFTV